MLLRRKELKSDREIKEDSIPTMGSTRRLFQNGDERKRDDIAQMRNVADKGS